MFVLTPKHWINPACGAKRGVPTRARGEGAAEVNVTAEQRGSQLNNTTTNGQNDSWIIHEKMWIAGCLQLPKCKAPLCVSWQFMCQHASWLISSSMINNTQETESIRLNPNIILPLTQKQTASHIYWSTKTINAFIMNLLDIIWFLNGFWKQSLIWLNLVETDQNIWSRKYSRTSHWRFRWTEIKRQTLPYSGANL